MSTLTRLSRSTIRAVASMPFSSGSVTSMTTTSGRSRSVISTAVRPSPVSPTISIAASVSRMRRRPWRTMVWASTRNTRARVLGSRPIFDVDDGRGIIPECMKGLVPSETPSVNHHFGVGAAWSGWKHRPTGQLGGSFTRSSSCFLPAARRAWALGGHFSAHGGAMAAPRQGAPPGGPLAARLPAFLHQQDHAVRLVVGRGEREAHHGAPEGLATPVARFESQLVRAAVPGHALAQRRPQLLHGQADVEVQEVLPPHLVGAQPPEVLGLAVPDLDGEVRVEDDDPRLHAGDDGLEEDVGAVQFVRAAMQLVVRRLELLVGRLQLLVH